MEQERPPGTADTSSAEQRLSYKFQRLRERIRAAIASGELIGKLPGERELARRFKVNTKTLSKALTDLAADGLVQRNIGLGTFVRGSQPREAARALLVHPVGRHEALIRNMPAELVDLTTQLDTADLPPTLVGRFDSIVIASDRVSDDLIRDLIVRGKHVITIGRRPGGFTTRAILVDEPSAAASLAQRLIHRGHRKLLILGYDADGEIAAAVRNATAHATATDSTAEVTVGQLTELADALQGGVTGVIVMPPFDPRQAITHASRIGFEAPAQVSFLAVGWDDAPPCSGQYVTAAQTASALTQLLAHPAAGRPVSVWLTGQFVDAGTLATAAAGPTATE